MNLLNITNTKKLSSYLLTPEVKIKDLKSKNLLHDFIYKKLCKYGIEHLKVAKLTYKKISSQYLKRNEYLYSKNSSIRILEESLMKIIRKTADQLLKSNNNKHYHLIELGKMGTLNSIFAKYEKNEIQIFSYSGKLFPELGDREYLGSGSFGVVQKVFDFSQGNFVALKVALINSRSIKEEVCHLNKLPKKKVQGLQGPIYSYGKIQQQMAFIAPFYSEGDLFDFVATYKFKKHEKKIKLKIAFDLLHGLKYLHQNKIIHGDIKPENCFINKIKNNEFEGVIGDFGEIIEPNEIANKFDNDSEFGTATTEGFFTYEDQTLLRNCLFTRNLFTWTMTNTKRDIFALASTIWYLFTESLPYALEEVKCNSFIFDLNGQSVKERKYPNIDKGLINLEKVSELISKKTLKLLVNALERNSCERPDINTLYDQFAKEIKKENSLRNSFYNACFYID